MLLTNDTGSEEESDAEDEDYGNEADWKLISDW